MASLNITDSMPVGFTCFWKIKNFHLCYSNPKFLLKSQIFKVYFGRYFRKWYLELQNQEEFLNIFLFQNGPQVPYTVQLTMSVLTNLGWESIISSSEVEISAGGAGSGTHNFIEWETIFACKDVYLLNDCLTVSCHVWNINTIVEPQQVLLINSMTNEKYSTLSRIQKFNSLKHSDFSYISGEITPKSSNDKALSHETEVNNEKTQSDQACNGNMLYDKANLLHMLAENDSCYVTLKTANKDFAVYKTLICTKSPVFCAMLKKEMKEKNVIYINDVDSDTLELMMQFLHLNTLGDLKWKAIVKLYHAANKYQIEQLKNECTLHLKSQLKTKNFCDILLLSDMYQDENFKLVVKEHFCKNAKMILKSKPWKNFLLRKTELAYEMLLALAEKL